MMWLLLWVVSGVAAIGVGDNVSVAVVGVRVDVGRVGAVCYVDVVVGSVGCVGDVDVVVGDDVGVGMFCRYGCWRC